MLFEVRNEWLYYDTEIEARVCLKVSSFLSRAFAPRRRTLRVVWVGRSAARGRPIIVEWERDARHSAGLSLVRRSSRGIKLLVPVDRAQSNASAPSRRSAATRGVRRVYLYCARADAVSARLAAIAQVAASQVTCGGCGKALALEI
ncbi:hypothetical protein EVAR_49201_1 [Eumeta japonica]|uniref:Uncharacterized protein n=1 Tax=Eumeta variegata TaxID=151549 RepID=A0A4C1XN64_EUMVA|nr:hypothetical protein EVAR_49201_1 [Eumeta japonica]